LKRSTHIEIGFLSFVAAAALTGCNALEAYHRDYQHCVNQRNEVVSDWHCDPSVTSTSGPHYYHWLYSSNPRSTGEIITDGYSSPRPNMSVARASSVSRGGFGSFVHGFGGGGA
jgi:hypothetical protein